MTRDKAMQNLTIKAILVDGVPMVSLEDCCREIRKIDESNCSEKPTSWHTRELTEEGLYVCYWGTKKKEPLYTLTPVTQGTIINPVAWQKIEPFSNV